MNNDVKDNLGKKESKIMFFLTISYYFGYSLVKLSHFITLFLSSMERAYDLRKS